MKATRVTYSACANEIVVKMSEADARELSAQMLAFWRSLSVGGQLPRGDSPFARIHDELKRVLGH